MNIQLLIKLFTVLFSVLISYAVKSEVTLLQLRENVAMNYMQPEPHLALARYHFQQGNKIQAFYIAENTRQSFGDVKFDQAFSKVARVPLIVEPKLAGEDELRNYIKENPDSLTAHWEKAIEDKKDPVKSLESFILKYPNHLHPKTMLALYYSKEKFKQMAAARLLIDAYFSNPHLYLSFDYVEKRIKNITSRNKSRWLIQERSKNNDDLSIIRSTNNPRVIDLIIDEARKSWKDEYFELMIEAMKNDDPVVQSRALHTILANPSTIKAKREQVIQMLSDKRATTRAMASFLVVKGLGESDFHLLKNNLSSKSELILIDVIQALAGMGGIPGKTFLIENKPDSLPANVEAMMERMLKRM